MSVYTISPDLLRNIEKDEGIYFTDILFVFTLRTNPFKVSKDKNGHIISSYMSVDTNGEIIKTWLDLMSFKPSPFEAIDVDLSEIDCEETMFMKICKETKNQNKLIVYTQQNLNKHKCEESIVFFEETAIKVLDRDEARDELLIIPLVDNGKTLKKNNVKTITIFLASSEELKEDRKEFEIFINRENKELNEKGIFLKLEVWEDFIDQMSKTRLQDEYNKAIIKSDLFISLFWTKVGKYSSEEFNKALISFQETGRPHIYTYFKNAPINPKEMNKLEINSRFDFIKELENLGHFPTNYESIEDLKYQFKKQLNKILPDLI